MKKLILIMLMGITVVTAQNLYTCDEHVYFHQDDQVFYSIKRSTLFTTQGGEVGVVAGFIPELDAYFMHFQLDKARRECVEEDLIVKFTFKDNTTLLMKTGHDMNCRGFAHLYFDHENYPDVYHLAHKNITSIEIEFKKGRLSMILREANQNHIRDVFYCLTNRHRWQN